MCLGLNDKSSATGSARICAREKGCLSRASKDASKLDQLERSTQSWYLLRLPKAQTRPESIWHAVDLVQHQAGSFEDRAKVSRKGTRCQEHLSRFFRAWSKVSRLAKRFLWSKCRFPPAGLFSVRKFNGNLRAVARLVVLNSSVERIVAKQGVAGWRLLRYRIANRLALIFCYRWLLLQQKIKKTINASASIPFEERRKRVSVLRRACFRQFLCVVTWPLDLKSSLKTTSRSSSCKLDKWQIFPPFKGLRWSPGALLFKAELADRFVYVDSVCVC